MSISADERRTRILAALRGLGEVRIADLAERLELPTVTVRRDVAALAEAGLVRRTHGSVSAVAVAGGTRLSPETADGLTLGMLVPGVGQYFDEVVAGARDAAERQGAHLVLGISGYRADADRLQVDQLLRSGARGLLLAPTWASDADPGGQDWAARLPVPAVLVERTAAAAGPAMRLDAVVSDHRHGVLLALRHLASLSHRRIALAARGDTRTADEVRRGYTEGCALLGLAPAPVVGSGPLATELGRAATELADLCAAGATAAVVHNDQDALRLLPLLWARGLRVPDDLAVVSYDDVFADLCDPPLTAVAPPKRAVGGAAVDLLLRRLGGGRDAAVHHLRLLPELTVRCSCGSVD
ncbi:substrate-binding domain-containing protein [Kitasatospora sp. NPDC004289]